MMLTGLVVMIGCKESPPEDSNETASTAVAAAEALENDEAPLPERPLVAGDEVYDFSALVHTGQRIKLSTFSRKPVVVYFCPNDRHPTCQTLATALRDSWLEINAQVDMVLGVSVDDVFHHRDFASEHELPHLLVSDVDGSLHAMFGLAPGVVTSYLIDTDGTVLSVLDTSNPSGHASTISAALAQLGKGRDPYPM